MSGRCARAQSTHAPRDASHRLEVPRVSVLPLGCRSFENITWLLTVEVSRGVSTAEEPGGGGGGGAAAVDAFFYRGSSVTAARRNG